MSLEVRSMKAITWVVLVHPDHRSGDDAALIGRARNAGHGIGIEDEVLVRRSRFLPPGSYMYVMREDQVSRVGGDPAHRLDGWMEGCSRNSLTCAILDGFIGVSTT